jgi:RNA polymerase sigma-70 factor (ECF subfamily)
MMETRPQADAATDAASDAMSELPAEELAVQARAGSRAAFDQLVVRFRPQLVAFLARRLSDAADAEDAAQEALVRAYDHLEQYDAARPFATWLFAIGKNVAANHAIARNRREARHRNGAPVAAGAAEAPGSDLWRRAQAVLTPDAYRMLWLRYARGLTVREIAAELDRSSVAVKVMLFRARRRLLQEVR